MSMVFSIRLPDELAKELDQAQRTERSLARGSGLRSDLPLLVKHDFTGARGGLGGHDVNPV